MKEKDFNKWTEVRKKGFLYFAIKDGVLSIGILLFIFNAFFRGFDLNKILLSLLVSATLGFLFGSLLWYFFDGRYERELTRRKYSNS